MVFELFQKLHMLLYATQLMTLKIIPLLFVLLNLEIVERKGKFEYLDNKRRFSLSFGEKYADRSFNKKML